MMVFRDSGLRRSHDGVTEGIHGRDVPGEVDSRIDGGVDGS